MIFLLGHHISALLLQGSEFSIAVFVLFSTKGLCNGQSEGLYVHSVNCLLITWVDNQLDLDGWMSNDHFVVVNLQYILPK